MSLLDAIILGALQGFTEFLPVSSSGHLILGQALLGLNVEDLMIFDVALHVATLLVIFVYFYKRLLQWRLWPAVLFGSLPAAFIGIFFGDAIEANFRSPALVALLMTFVGLLFVLSPFLEKKLHEKRAMSSNVAFAKPWSFASFFLVGLAQAVAILPGVSRSGSTILSAKLLGFEAEEAAEISFLLGAVAIGGAGLLKSLDWAESGFALPAGLSFSALGLGMLVALLTGFLSVHLLLKGLKRFGLRPFGIYLIIVGSLGVWWG